MSAVVNGSDPACDREQDVMLVVPSVVGVHINDRSGHAGCVEVMCRSYPAMKEFNKAILVIQAV